MLAGLACADKVGVDVAETAPTAVDPADLLQGVDLVQAQEEGSGQISDACLTEVQAAEQRPITMHVMLDSSGSMEEVTATGATKWQSVQRAIRLFMAETLDSDLSIGLQFFPQVKPGTSYTCTSHDDCGDDGGLCYLSTCTGGTEIRLCRDIRDCSDIPNSQCVRFGLCSNSDPDAPTACVLRDGRTTRCEGDLGVCQDFERVCMEATSCDPDQYQVPAVEIGTIRDRVETVDQILATQPLQGLTPTAPALSGGIAHARQWAVDHPEQTVITVLATDGLPTDCGVEDGDVSQAVEVAAAGVEGSPSVRTVVIGVFDEVLESNALSAYNMNLIAQAGDTDEAVLIDSGDDVSDRFLEALRSVRSNTLACEFALPEAGVNYFRVNLEFRPEGGTAEQLTYVSGEGQCDPNGGNWFYDVDPASGGTPTRIEVCPNVCERFKAARNADFSLQVGCQTVIL